MDENLFEEFSIIRVSGSPPLHVRCCWTPQVGKDPEGMSDEVCISDREQRWNEAPVVLRLADALCGEKTGRYELKEKTDGKCVKRLGSRR